MSKEFFLDSPGCSPELKPHERVSQYVYPLEITDPASQHTQIRRLTRWCTIWKCTTAVSFLSAAVSVIIAAMVVNYSRNPTFVNDFLITSFVGSWYSPSSLSLNQIPGGSSAHGHHSHSSIMSSTMTVEKLNRGKPVLPIHSHNDYWRHVPFFEAIHLGCQSIEADVWHLSGQPNELFVGHHKRSLSSFNNLQNMYLDPLETLLDSVNAHDVLVDGSNSRLGVFDYDPSSTLYFVLDVKNDPSEVFELIERSFDNFYKKDYLTTYNTTSSTWSYGPVTLIISGNAPLDGITAQEIRTMFVDAPMEKILKDSQSETMYELDRGISIFASSSLKQLTGSKALRFSGGLTVEESRQVQLAIDKAHEMGLKIRVWDTPAWPQTQRDSVWRDLIELGVDLINTDDLRSAVEL